MVPEKVGLKSIQRPEIEYDFTLVFDLNMKNHATASKDRTGLFFGKPEQKLKIETGKMMQEWCNSGVDMNVDYISIRIGDCKTIKKLLDLYQQSAHLAVLQPEFEQQKRTILINQEVTNQLTNQNINQNGKY